MAVLMRPAQFAVGERLADSSEVSPGLLLIASGRVQMPCVCQAMQETTSGSPTPATLKGEIPLLLRETYPIRAIALEPTVAWVLDAPRLTLGFATGTIWLAPLGISGRHLLLAAVPLRRDGLLFLEDIADGSALRACH